MNVEPLYVVTLDNGYYSAEYSYQEVSIEKADKLSHKEANKIRNSLSRLGFNTQIVKIET